MGKRDCEINGKVSFRFGWLLGLFFHFDTDEQTLMELKFLGCGTHSGHSHGLSCLQDRIKGIVDLASYTNIMQC